MTKDGEVCSICGWCEDTEDSPKIHEAHIAHPPRTLAALDPLLMTWPTGEVVYRCYDVCCDVHGGSRDFSAGDAAHPGRFHPLTPGRRRTPLPGLYGAGDLAGALIDGALSETVCHDVPILRVAGVCYRPRHNRSP